MIYNKYLLLLFIPIAVFQNCSKQKDPLYMSDLMSVKVKDGACVDSSSIPSGFTPPSGQAPPSGAGNAVPCGSSTANLGSSCAGTYTATIGANVGEIALNAGMGTSISGTLYLQGYSYTMIGNCDRSAGSVQIVNQTTGSTYNGAVNSTGSVYMSGTFKTSNGNAYSWSMNQIL